MEGNQHERDARVQFSSHVVGSVNGQSRSDARKRRESLPVWDAENFLRAPHPGHTAVGGDIWNEVLEESAERRREHVMASGGTAGPKHDTARTVAVPAHTILATISLRDDVTRERAE